MPRKPEPTRLERHAYAPELNRLHAFGGVYAAPHCLTIKDAMRLIFGKGQKVARGILATVTFERFDESGACRFHKVYSGFVASRKDALAFARNLAATRHAGGVLFDGSILPPATYRIQFKLKG